MNKNFKFMRGENLIFYKFKNRKKHFYIVFDLRILKFSLII